MNYYDTSSLYGTTTYGNAVGTAAAATTAALIGVIILWIIAGAAAIVTLIALYKLFKKAGKVGYEALIPFHDTFVLFQLAGINPVWILGLVFGAAVAFIPVLGWIVYPAYCIFIEIWLNIRLAKTFGKETGFGVLMAFFPFVMYPILAFGDAKYTKPAKVINKPGEDK